MPCPILHFPREPCVNEATRSTMVSSREQSLAAFCDIIKLTSIVQEMKEKLSIWWYVTLKWYILKRNNEEGSGNVNMLFTWMILKWRLLCISEYCQYEEPQCMIINIWQKDIRAMGKSIKGIIPNDSIYIGNLYVGGRECI